MRPPHDRPPTHPPACRAEAEAAKAALVAADTTYQSLKGQRHQLFTDCFETVASVIDGVYKEFTTSAQHPMGGSASLTLLNDADPFDPEGACDARAGARGPVLRARCGWLTCCLPLPAELPHPPPPPPSGAGGVRYSFQPPGKTFMEPGGQSGGEKTVAALALLFGMHHYRPAPFLVMDEIDAALDPVNVHKVASYIRKRATTRGGGSGGGGGARSSRFTASASSSSVASGGDDDDGGLQALVISLKDTFYEKAQGLIGVFRDVQSNSSGTLTLDLSGYPAGASAPSSQAATPASAGGVAPPPPGQPRGAGKAR